MDSILYLAAHDGDEIVYVAVEATASLQDRHIRRASRNAELLGLFTGSRTLPAVAGAELDEDITDRIIFDVDMIPEGKRIPDIRMLPDGKMLFMEISMPS